MHEYDLVASTWLPDPKVLIPTSRIAVMVGWVGRWSGGFLPSSPWQCPCHVRLVLGRAWSALTQAQS